MKRLLAAAALGAGLFVGVASAQAASLGLLPHDAAVGSGLIEKTAWVCNEWGRCWHRRGYGYGYGPRYGYYDGPRYVRRCAWRVRPGPYGPRRVRVCW